MTPSTNTLGNFCSGQEEFTGKPRDSPELLDGRSVDIKEGDEVSKGTEGGTYGGKIIVM